MPFRETCRMEERIAMLRDYDTGAFTVSELVARYGVSRETFYVWKRRRESGEERWFEAISRAPSPFYSRGCVICADGRRRSRWLGV